MSIENAPLQGTGRETGASEPDFAQDDKLLSARQVRAVLGGCSDMTIWRYLADEELGFPRPCYIRRRRFWRAGDLRRWLQERRRDR